MTVLEHFHCLVLGGGTLKMLNRGVVETPSLWAGLSWNTVQCQCSLAPSEWGPGLGHVMFFLSVRAKGGSELRKEVVGGAGVGEDKLWAVCRTPAPDSQQSQAGGGTLTDDFVRIIRRTARLPFTL